MAKIVMIETPCHNPNQEVMIHLVRCHVEWLKKHGICIAANPEQETLAYSRWASANRAHPLLVECLELHKDAVAQALSTANNLIRSMTASEHYVQGYASEVARNIVKKKGRGHLPVEEVRACIEREMTFDEILSKHQDNYRHKSHTHPNAEFAIAQKYSKILQEATQTVCEFFVQSDILDEADVVNGNTNYVVMEYDGTKFAPKIVMKATPVAYDDEINWEYREALHLVPIETEEITAACLTSFVQEGDHEGLLRYLRERGVRID